MYTYFTKPILDHLLAFAGLLFLGPFLLTTSVWLGLTTGQNPVIRQRRIGYQDRLFWLYKFRTMTSARDKMGHLLPDADRITPLGHFLRRTSIDELPQLLNILLGQMSFVGPRPLLAEYGSCLAGHKRHTVRPGLTGWAQVHGRNNRAWPEKFALDVWYVDHISFLGDCLILWRTLPVVLDTSPPVTRLDATTFRTDSTDQ